MRLTADRVARVVVGLRPYRPGGYVVRAETLGSKRVVHNYGHGGSGITLSWGTSHQAADIGFAGEGRSHAVIGAGAVGLATARLIQLRGGKVTIYAASLPPDTTSNIAGGQFHTSWLYEGSAVDEAWKSGFREALRLSYRHFQAYVGGPYGVSWRRNYFVSDERQDFGPLSQSVADTLPEMTVLEPGQHPFGRRYVQRFTAMQIEPMVYLQALLEDILLAGGQVVVRRFASPQELAALPESTVFNCTGLGARALFGDATLTAARGQLVVFLPQPELDYNLTYGATYIFPRSDGVITGGTFERDNWSLEPDPETTRRILAGAAETSALMRGR
ncbi:MAG: FAD-binding oxidoreductase [Caulobacteraceae bacterium]|nr:FAD-binding oxidoreductase [Caulobacteraceae bacterium]